MVILFMVKLEQSEKLKMENIIKKGLHNALFVGILGDPSPKYVAAVIIREPKDREGSGGYHAAPMFGEFIQPRCEF